MDIKRRRSARSPQIKIKRKTVKVRDAVQGASGAVHIIGRDLRSRTWDHEASKRQHHPSHRCRKTRRRGTNRYKLTMGVVNKVCWMRTYRSAAVNAGCRNAQPKLALVHCGGGGGGEKQHG